MTHRRLALAFGMLTITGAAPVLAQPLGTAFTYQGRLADSGTPATGLFDFQLILFDGPAGGAQVGPIISLDDVAVSQGLFTVTLDFGAVFSGNRRWLQVGVRPGASTGAYGIVSPRQEMTASPASLFSSTTPWTGVSGKPPGFADNVDNDLLGGLVCAIGQVAKRTAPGWTCAADLDTTYSQGAGISIAGTVILIAPSGVNSSMILDGTIGSTDLAADSVTATHIAVGAVGSAEIATDAVGAVEIGTGAVGSPEIATDAVGADEIAFGAVGPLELSSVVTSDFDSRYVNVSDVLTNANYGGCGTYSVMNCGLFFGGQAGPLCNAVPPGGICKATGSGTCAGAVGNVCGDGSGWYLKTGN